MHDTSQRIRRLCCAKCSSSQLKGMTNDQKVAIIVLLPSLAAVFLEKPNNLDVASSLLPEKPASGYYSSTILPIGHDILRPH